SQSSAAPKGARFSSSDRISATVFFMCQKKPGPEWSAQVISKSSEKIGMRRRPWPIVILALLQIFSPALSVMLSAWKLQTPVRHFIWMMMKYGTTGQLFELFGTSLIAAVAIFAVKRWSYPVFLTIFAWGAYSNISVWHQYPQVYSI